MRALILETDERPPLSDSDAWQALEVWRRLGLTHHPVTGMIERIWQLRENPFPTYDGCYVALAEELGYPLLTCDGQLGQAPRLGCTVTVVAGYLRGRGKGGIRTLEGA